MRPQTTLVLGAGASFSYGFPVGSGLRRQLLELPKNLESNAAILVHSVADIQAFVNEFREAQNYSIDAFLGRHLEFSSVGKAAIAKVLLECESSCNLFREDHSDHWYQYLLNELVKDPWDDFDPSWLSIVTFNYDRSLETYLARAVRANYNKSEAEVLERLRTIKIVHVYGSLGGPWMGDKGFLPFNRHPDQLRDAIAQAAQRIKVIPEGRDDEDTIRDARALLGAATCICFLGFGFDDTNVHRLGAPGVFLHSNGQPKRLAATTVSLAGAFVEKASKQVVGEPAYSKGARLQTMSLNCLDLLRHTLILD